MVFYRDRSADDRIEGLVDNPHAAAPQFADHLVAPDSLHWYIDAAVPTRDALN